MNTTVKKSKWIVPFVVIALVLVIDQVVKIMVKTHMFIGQDIPLIGEWCRLHFIENEGMAFGMAFGGRTGKLILTIFRLLASGGILWFMCHQIRKGARMLFIVSLALIFCGAIGNVVDSCFYGLIFNESFFNVAELFPATGGYDTFGHGKVVDMFYFPLIDTTWPEWVPFVGGGHFEFFNAIFNVADAAITIGVVLLLADQLFFEKKPDQKVELQVEKSDEIEKNENVSC